MSTITFEQFKVRTAQKLGVLAVGDALSAEDGELIGRAAQELADILSTLDLLTLDFDDGVDVVYAGALTDMVAASLVGEYGVPEPRKSQMLTAGLFGLPNTSLAERRLRKAIAGVSPDVRVTAEYF